MNVRDGYSLVRDAPMNAGALVGSARFRLKSVASDHLVCRSWDGAAEGAVDVLVAKSFLLRKTPFDGQSRNGVAYVYTTDVERVADNGTATETQVVVEPYVVGDEVYATRQPLRGTGVEGVDWLDDNRDGRAWAKKAT